MIKAILFELDSCLSPADEPGRELLDPVFAAIRREDRGRLSEEALEQAFSDCWRHALDVVARAHGFSAEMLAGAGGTAIRGQERLPTGGPGGLRAPRRVPNLTKIQASSSRPFWARVRGMELACEPTPPRSGVSVVLALSAAPSDLEP